VSAERLAARAWFTDAKFGMFIHWGVYSQLGAGEWVMHNRQIGINAYEALAATFDPTKFDAQSWVALARRADGGGTIHTNAQITGKAASMGEGVVAGVLDALIKDFTTRLGDI